MATDGNTLHLRLYIARNAPNSAMAQINLAIICQGVPSDQLNLEIVDVLQEPLRALQDKVFVTPVLHKLAPLPEVRIVGDLHDHARVRLALGLEEEQ